VVKTAVLAAHGIPRPKDKAEIGIIFGCYLPFATPFLVRDYVRLLDLLGVDYTYFDQEFCCGVPLVMQATEEEELERILAVGKEFNELNLGQAQQKGVKTLAYCCIGCTHAAKNSFPDAPDRHIYCIDLVLDKLEKETLKVAPTVMGYFEGCHTFYRGRFPQVTLNWERYRQMVGKIEGLKIVDLPNNLCCKRSADKIIENAEKLNLDKILCACTGCNMCLSPAAKGKVQLVSLPEVLLQGLERR
jgi:Fe-S oxidoreductase